MNPSALNEHELLELVEGRLSAERARALRAELQSMGSEGVKAVGLLDAMTADRAALMGLAEPSLPADFVSELEPMLARPMLFGNSVGAGGRVASGSYRRAQSRQARMRGRMRVAAMAAGLMVMIGGSWMLTRDLLSRRDAQESRDLVAGGSKSVDEGAHLVVPGAGMMGGPSGARDAARGRTGDGLPDGAVVHHHVDVSSGAGALLRTGGEGMLAGNGARSGGGVGTAGECALVFAMVDARDVERVIASCIAEGEAGVALVRNFSFAEAEHLEEAWRLAQARRGGGSPSRVLIAERPTEFARRVEDQMRGLPEGVMKEFSGASGVVAGPRSLQPSFERQLVYSSKGAAYTLVVRAGDLEGMMRKLSVAVAASGARGHAGQMWLALFAEGGEPATVVARPRDGNGGAGTVAERWSAGRTEAAAVLAELAAREPGSILELPLVVRP